jgi:hypothetical protein
MNFKRFGTQVPTEYQEFTFIANSGTQYIDTGLKGSDLADCEVEIVMRNDTTLTTAYNFNGTYLSGSTAQFGLVATSSSECRSSMNFGFADAISTIGLNLSDFHTIYATNGLQKVDNTVVGTLNFGTLNNGSFLLFARTDPNQTSGINICAGMSLKSFTVKRNNQYIRNMIPAKRKSDNTFGLYDTANGVFYTNQGTGDFTGGTVIESTWTDIPYYIHKTATDTLTLPAVIYPNDTSITVGIKGQSSQASTPTPQNPVDVNGYGERTGNLAYGRIDGVNVGSNGTIVRTDVYAVAIGSVESGKVYTINSYVLAFYTDEPTIGSMSYDGSRIVAIKGTPTTFTAPITGYVAFRVESGEQAMLNSDSTALPYEPYGYKIPILLNSQTINKYLGTEQTVRQIKKWVLTGQEDWVMSASFTGGFYLASVTPDYMRIESGNLAACTHYVTVNQTTSVGNLTDKQLSFSSSNTQRLYIRDINYTTAETFKTYLQQQYSNGTPVTVWYVLSSPATAITNEPLMKIGDYTDSLTTSVSCTAGENTLDVQTTVAPSEVTATFEGWHPVSDVHIYPDSSWMPTSWEEFRKAVRSGKAQQLYPVGTKLYENWGDTTSNAWIVVDYPTGEDYLDSDLAQQGYTNRVMLMEEKLTYLRQFDAIEAWLYVETAIPAGTYRFTIPNYDATYGGNKTYIFTSTADVPVGGQLTLTWAHNTNPTKVQGYSSSNSTSALFDVTIAEWDGTTACTDLGTIKLAQNDPDSTYGKLNHIHRSRYGSNNYYQSGYRQWLNTNASANWWMPTNVFDRPYGHRTNAGRLNVMNSNMKSVLATPTVNCITNNLFEYPSLDGTTFSLQTAYTVTDKLFPVTHSEINLSSSPNVNSVLDYYVGAQNADRIKSYYWWLRTPDPTSASTVRYVNTSGALGGSGASGTIGSAAACIIQ